MADDFLDQSQQVLQQFQGAKPPSKVQSSSPPPSKPGASDDPFLTQSASLLQQIRTPPAAPRQFKSMDTGTAMGGAALGAADVIRGMGISAAGTLAGVAGLPFGKGSKWMQDTEDFLSKHTGLSPKQEAGLGTKTKAAREAVVGATEKVMNAPVTLADTGVSKDFKGVPMTPESLKAENQDRFVQDTVATILPYLLGGEESGGKFKIRGDETPKAPPVAEPVAVDTNVEAETPVGKADEFGAKLQAKYQKPSETAPAPPIESGGRRATSGVHQEVRQAYDSLGPAEREDTPLRDKLTNTFSPAMYHAVKGAERPQVFIDLRDFKTLQEPAGKAASHGFGDEVLKAVGQEAQKLNIPLFRYGGDEFAILGDKDLSMGQVRKLKESLQNRTVRYTSKDGTVYETKGIDLDYGYGKNRDAADAESKINKTANKAAAGPKAGREPGTVAETPAEGRQTGSAVPELASALRGTNAEHTPVTLDERGNPPPGYQINHVRFGNEEIALPVRDVYASPKDAVLEKVGHREFQAEQAGKRLPVDNQLMREFREVLPEYPWASRDMRQNLAYALDAYLKKKDIRQLGYAKLENKSGADAIFKDPGAHALTFNWKDEYMPDKTVVKCFG